MLCRRGYSKRVHIASIALNLLIRELFQSVHDELLHLVPLVPTSRAFKECSYRFLTVPVHEFRTTKMYNGDNQTILKAVQRSPGLAMV
jgi:hypothetical protein